MNKKTIEAICPTLTIGGLELDYLSLQEKEFILAKQPAGVSLFSRNITAPNIIKKLELTNELQACLKDQKTPFIIAVDQEGGQVARFKHPLMNQGPSFSLAEGKTDKEALTKIHRYAKDLGHSLLTCGFNVNFAPVVDITISESIEKCAINNRAFGLEENIVTPRAKAFLHGLNESKVSGCLKHYPGIGGIAQDTHNKTVILKHSEEELRKKHILPFIKLHEHSKLIMASHCIYPQICPKEASRSHTFLTKILRQEFGYEGLIISDDLCMNAVTNAEISWEDYIKESIIAGCDLLLICRGLERWKLACHVIELEAEKNPSFRKRVEESYERIQKFRKSLPSC